MNVSAPSIHGYKKITVFMKRKDEDGNPIPKVFIPNEHNDPLVGEPVGPCFKVGDGVVVVERASGIYKFNPDMVEADYQKAGIIETVPQPQVLVREVIPYDAIDHIVFEQDYPSFDVGIILTTS